MKVGGGQFGLPTPVCNAGYGFDQMGTLSLNSYPDAPPFEFRDCVITLKGKTIKKMKGVNKLAPSSTFALASRLPVNQGNPRLTFFWRLTPWSPWRRQEF